MKTIVNFPPDLSINLEGISPLLANNITVLEYFFVNNNNYMIVGRQQSADGSHRSTANIYLFDQGRKIFNKTGNSQKLLFILLVILQT